MAAVGRLSNVRDHRNQFVLNLTSGAVGGRIDKLGHVDGATQLNRFADLPAQQAEPLQLDAKDCRRPFDQALFLGRNLDVTLLALVHAVCVFAVAADLLLSEMHLEGVLDVRDLPDVEQQIHEVLEGRRNVFAPQAGDVLPHVPAEDLVEGGRLFAGVVQGLELGALRNQVGAL